MDNLLDYVRVILRRFWALLGGGSLSVIGLAVYEHYAQKAASWNIYAGIIALCLIVAIFGQGVSDYARLKPRMRIGPLEQQFPSMQAPWVLYYFSISNESEAVALGHVAVRLMRLDPRVPTMNWLPVPLHLKHDNKTPFLTEFTLNPGEMKHIDLVELMSTRELEIKHVVPGVTKEIPYGKYRLTVEATAENSPPIRALFEVRIGSDGNLKCVSL